MLLVTNLLQTVGEYVFLVDGVQNVGWVQVGVKFVGCSQVRMAYHSAEELGVDACFGCLGS